MVEFAQLDRGEFGLCRTAASEHVHVGDGGRGQHPMHVVGNLGVQQLVAAARQHPGDVQPDIADTDHRDRGRGAQVPGLLAVRVRVVEGDEFGGSVGAGQLHATEVEVAVSLGAGGEDDGVVELAHFVDLDVRADLHVAEELDPVRLHHPVQRDDDLLDPRMVGCDAVPDQAVRSGQPVEDVNRDVGVVLAQDVGGIDAGGAGSDDSDAQGLGHA